MIGAHALPLGCPMADDEAVTKEDALQQPIKKGAKGLPKGVSETKGKREGAPIKYQARVGYKPDGASKVEQRGLGTFDTATAAAAAVAAAEAQLAAGIVPWAQSERKKT